MSYSTSNPPQLLMAPIGGVGAQLWTYASTDAAADVDLDGYFSNAKELGMRVGDVVFVLDTDSTHKQTTTHIVKAINANGSANLSDGVSIGGAADND